MTQNQPLDSIPPILVINLESSVERRAYMTAQLSRLGLPFEFFNAVDGRTLAPQTLKAVYDPQAALECVGVELTPGQLGCYLSHLQIWERMVAQNLERVVILEDDAVIQPGFLTVLQKMSTFPPDWELIRLFDREGETYYSCWGQHRIDKGYKLVKYIAMVASTVGYLLTQSGARKLLTHAYPLRMPVDYLCGGFVRTGLHVYGVRPKCLKHAGLPSTI